MCSNIGMRWDGQRVDASGRGGGLAAAGEHVRTMRPPEFSGVVVHEVLAKSALNRVPGGALPFSWTINPYRGCTHACTFCFARSTHEYLDLDAGADFDGQIVAKVNVADVLAGELVRPSWRREPVALGTNTDPYQRVEGRYRLMPGIIAALAASGTPLSILTKGGLIRRDVPLLVEARERVPVEVAMTIDLVDADLAASLESGAPSTAARLATVRALADAGLAPTVFVMPVLPHLSDSAWHLDELLGRIAAAGAAGVAWSALHLRPGAREWFFAWLERERPDLLPRYRALYRGSAYAPGDYRAALAARIRPLLRRHGLDRAPRLDPGTGTPRAAGPGSAGAAGVSGLLAAELPLRMASSLQPALF